jgi:hypothetical protein
MGPVYLASSCLQGQPLTEAVSLCDSVGVAHLQLCPGNLPGLSAKAEVARLSTRTHHGFSWSRVRTSVWNPDGSLAVEANSVHPPKRGEVDEAAWWRRLERGEFGVLEVMYPPYLLSDDASVERALATNAPLAIDISHLHIMHATGALSAQGLRKVEEYEHIAEVHVSSNDGRADQHRPLHRNSFFLGWAKERRAAGVPIILECYMHRLSHDARRQQLELLERS